MIFLNDSKLQFFQWNNEHSDVHKNILMSDGCFVVHTHNKDISGFLSMVACLLP